MFRMWCILYFTILGISSAAFIDHNDILRASKKSYELDTGEVQTFNSPKYPDKYGKNSKKTWEFTCSNVNANVKLTCSFFNTESKSDCEKSDYMEVVDGNKVVDEIICGKQDPFATIISSDNYLKVKFRTNGNKKKRKGFECSAQCIIPTTTTSTSTTTSSSTTSSTTTTTSSTTTTSTTSTSTSTTTSSTTTSTTTTSSTTTSTSTTTTTSSTTSTTSTTTTSSTTTSTTTTTTTTPIPTTTTPIPTTTTAPPTTTTPSVQTTTPVPPLGCGTHEISPGKCYPIQSPKYPKPYCGRSKCCWDITCTDPDSTIEFSCDLFDTQKHRDCNRGDYVNVYDDSSLLESVCGKQNPFAPIVSDSNYMKIRFAANGDRTKGAGFDCCVKCSASSKGAATDTTVAPIAGTTEDPADLPRLPCKCGVATNPDSDQHSLYNHPWTVALLDNSNKIICSGAIINSYHILTSKSCVSGRGKLFKIRANEHQLGLNVPRAITRNPASVLINRDLALIKMDVTLSLTNWDAIKPACLPNNNKEFSGSSATHSGYDHSKCMKNDGTFSSGSSGDRLTFKPSDKAFCREDNGGPVVSLQDGKHYLAGIALDDPSCASNGGISSSQDTAKVSSYYQWIMDNSNTGRFCER